MSMVSTHGQATGLPGNDCDKTENMTMHVMEADARFLRGILFALVLSTAAIGAAAGYAAVQHFPATQGSAPLR